MIRFSGDLPNGWNLFKRALGLQKKDSTCKLKMIIRVLHLFWIYLSLVSFSPSTQLPSKKGKVLNLSRFGRRLWKWYIKVIHLEIPILLCWICVQLGQRKSENVSPGRKSENVSPYLGSRHSPIALSLKSFCSHTTAEKSKRFSFLFLLPSSFCLHQHSSKPVLWGIRVYKGPLSQTEQSDSGPSDRLASYWSKAPGTQVAKFLYLDFSEPTISSKWDINIQQ